MEWKFNDTMSFLVPHLQPKRSGINVWHFGKFSMASLAAKGYLLFMFFLQNKKNLGGHNSKRGNICHSSVDLWIWGAGLLHLRGAETPIRFLGALSITANSGWGEGQAPEVLEPQGKGVSVSNHVRDEEESSHVRCGGETRTTSQTRVGTGRMLPFCHEPGPITP